MTNIWIFFWTEDNGFDEAIHGIYLPNESESCLDPKNIEWRRRTGTPIFSYNQTQVKIEKEAYYGFDTSHPGYVPKSNPDGKPIASAEFSSSDLKGIFSSDNGQSKYKIIKKDGTEQVYTFSEPFVSSIRMPSRDAGYNRHLDIEMPIIAYKHPSVDSPVVGIISSKGAYPRNEGESTGIGTFGTYIPNDGYFSLAILYEIEDWTLIHLAGHRLGWVNFYFKKSYSEKNDKAKIEAQMSKVFGVTPNLKESQQLPDEVIPAIRAKLPKTQSDLRSTKYSIRFLSPKFSLISVDFGKRTDPQSGLQIENGKVEALFFNEDFVLMITEQKTIFNHVQFPENSVITKDGIENLSGCVDLFHKSGLQKNSFLNATIEIIDLHQYKLLEGFSFMNKITLPTGSIITCNRDWVDNTPSYKIEEIEFPKPSIFVTQKLNKVYTDLLVSLVKLMDQLEINQTNIFNVKHLDHPDGEGVSFYLKNEKLISNIVWPANSHIVAPNFQIGTIISGGPLIYRDLFIPKNSTFKFKKNSLTIESIELSDDTDNRFLFFENEKAFTIPTSERRIIKVGETYPLCGKQAEDSIREAPTYTSIEVEKLKHCKSFVFDDGGPDLPHYKIEEIKGKWVKLASTGWIDSLSVTSPQIFKIGETEVWLPLYYDFDENASNGLPSEIKAPKVNDGFLNAWGKFNFCNDTSTRGFKVKLPEAVSSKRGTLKYYMQKNEKYSEVPLHCAVY